MRAIAPSSLLRAGLLDDLRVLMVSGSSDAGHAVGDACVELGARVWECVPDADGGPSSLLHEEAAMDEAVQRALADMGGVELLVIDVAGLFADAPKLWPADAHDRARAALRGCMEASWNATRATANHAFLPAERGGRVVLIAPREGAGEHAGAARSGLENLARTLSVEWARHGITAVTIAPGPQTAAGEVAAVTAYLASAAGAYFSGCVLTMGSRPVSA